MESGRGVANITLLRAYSHARITLLRACLHAWWYARQCRQDDILQTCLLDLSMRMPSFSSASESSELDSDSSSEDIEHIGFLGLSRFRRFR